MAYRKSRKKEETTMEEPATEFERVDETEELISEEIIEKDLVPVIEETLAPLPEPASFTAPIKPERPSPLPKRKQPRNVPKFMRG